MVLSHGVGGSDESVHVMLDGNPRLNLASFAWMEPECDEHIQASVNKNYVDMDEYPVTTELQAPLSPNPFAAVGVLYIGCSTVLCPSVCKVLESDMSLAADIKRQERGDRWISAAISLSSSSGSV